MDTKEKNLENDIESYLLSHGYVKGEGVILIIYDDVFELACPKDIVVERENKYGLVNYQGEILLPLIYDSLRMDGNARLVRVERNHEWGCIDLNLI